MGRRMEQKEELIGQLEATRTKNYKGMRAVQDTDDKPVMLLNKWNYLFSFLNGTYSFSPTE